MVIRSLPFLLFISPIFGFADQVVEVQNKAYWICKYQKDVRTIRVHVKNDGMCSTYYSKQGAEKMVGSGRHQETCHNFLNNIKTNLEKSNWACRDISSSRITASAEEKPSQ